MKYKNFEKYMIIHLRFELSRHRHHFPMVLAYPGEWIEFYLKR